MVGPASSPGAPARSEAQVLGLEMQAYVPGVRRLCLLITSFGRVEKGMISVRQERMALQTLSVLGTGFLCCPSELGWLSSS